MSRNQWFLKGFALSSVFLTGCFTGEDDLRAWMETRRLEMRPYVLPIKEPLVFAPQAYTEGQNIDPFNLLKLTNVLMREMDMGGDKGLALLAEQRNRRKEELESFPLDNITMVGSINKNGANVALLLVNNLIYQVKVGNYIGQNYGKIINIDENKVELREIVQDAGGEWVERMTSLDLQEKG